MICYYYQNIILYFKVVFLEEYIMARIVRPTWAIRCVQSGCKCLFEVAVLENGKQQEVVCPNCGEHYVYPAIDDKQQ